MPFDAKSTRNHDAAVQNPFAAADLSAQGALAQLTSGLSPLVAAKAWFDWASQLSMSPGKQLDLALQAGEGALRLGNSIYRATTNAAEKPAAAVGDHRFAHDGWQDWPYNVFQQAFFESEKWWRSATTGIRGLSRHHERLMSFGTQQALHAFSPANYVLTNPELWRETVARGGQNLVEGAYRFAVDTHATLAGQSAAESEFAVGRNLAITPGRVVFRNQLIELIQYDPATPTVFPEPILIVPAWIMKYYILDLQPKNSLIKFLVDHGHTVFTISWRNPTDEHCDLGMDDYLRSGVMAAFDAVHKLIPDRKIHTCGYCLGGTILSIAAAAMAREGDGRIASMTLLAAQTDFSEPGELKLFIDDTALAWLDGLMSTSGYLDGSRMGGAFQLLRADDLLWGTFVRRYLLGETDHASDIMSWNADQTRMPYRMHTEYLHSMFLRNELSQGHFVVNGRPVALCDIRMPIFALGTSHDHVAPWHSVFKVNLLTRSEVTFALVSGGHNAGVVSEPGHRGRTYQLLTKASDGPYVDPDSWSSLAPHHDGSWWPEWQRWLADRSGERRAPPAAGEKLCDAPGTYILER
jgi:polyhydroxyalkanoate synthase subunit PhaC